MHLTAAAADFARGGLAGLVVCMPPGPMSTLCVSRSVRHGFLAGFALAAGAALGDALYAGVAAFGLVSLLGGLGAAARWIAAAATPLLLWVGLRSLRAWRRGTTHDVADGTKPPPRPLHGTASGLGLALGTPGTLPAFVALFAVVGAERGDTADTAAWTPALLTAGSLCGALLWWAAVSALSCRFRAAASRWLRSIDLVCGILLVAAALAAAHVAITGAGLPAGE